MVPVLMQESLFLHPVTAALMDHHTVLFLFAGDENIRDLAILKGGWDRERALPPSVALSPVMTE
jgi:hypothetical protein